MNTEIYFGNLKECTYAGYVGNLFGVEHDKLLKEGCYFVKVEENKYVLVEDLLSHKRKKKTFSTSAFKKGDVFVSDLVLINDLVEAKKKIKTR